MQFVFPVPKRPACELYCAQLCFDSAVLIDSSLLVSLQYKNDLEQKTYLISISTTAVCLSEQVKRSCVLQRRPCQLNPAPV